MIHPKAKQSLFDIAMEHAGSTEAAWDIAVANKLSIADDLNIDIPLSVPAILNQRIVTFFQSIRHSPATNMTNTEIENLVGVGIGFMSIEGNFIVY